MYSLSLLFFAPMHVVGTELCAVVETMYSYKMLFSVIGDPILILVSNLHTYSLTITYVP